MVLVCILNELAFLVDAELCINRLDVVFYSVWRDIQLRGNLLFVLSLVHQFHHSQLLPGKRAVELRGANYILERALTTERTIYFLEAKATTFRNVDGGGVQLAEIALDEPPEHKELVVSRVASAFLIHLLQCVVCFGELLSDHRQHLLNQLGVILSYHPVSSVLRLAPKLALVQIEL